MDPAGRQNWHQPIVQARHLAMYLARDLTARNTPGCLLVIAFPTEKLEALLAGHVAAFEFFGGVFQEIWPDYVPGHIMGVMLPSALCGRDLGEWRGIGVALPDWSHNQRAVPI